MKGKVLVTGGLGYLGGRVVKSLLEQNYSVRILSRHLQYDSLPQWLAEQEIIAADILDKDSLKKAVQGITHVVHLAALNEVECSKSAEKALMINSYGTKLLADCSVEAGIQKFIYLSTAHVYANPLAGIFSEKDAPQPGHPYSISKLAGEHFLKNNPNLECTILRLSNGFGYPIHSDIQRWCLLFNDLCRQAVTTREMVLNSDGMQFRNFITFHDVTRCILHFLKKSDKKLGCECYNVGSEESIRIIDVAQHIGQRCESLFGFIPSLERKQSPVVENKHIPLKYVIEKLKETGFELENRMDDEVDALLHFCKVHFGGKRL